MVTTNHEEISGEVKARDRGPLSGNDLIELAGANCTETLGTTQGCNTTMFQEELTISSVEGYEDYNFTVIVRWFECHNPPMLEFSFSDFQLLSHDCPQFGNDISAASSEGQEHLGEFLKDFDRKMYESIERYFIQLNSSSIACMSGSSLIFSWYLASCKGWCTLPEEGEEDWCDRLNPIPPVLRTAIKIDCGNGCCRRQTIACLNSDGSIMSTTYINPVDHDGNGEFCDKQEPFVTSLTDAYFGPNTLCNECIEIAFCTYTCE